MAQVLLALWKAHEGKEQVVRDVIATMTPLSRAEPGCLHYQAHVAADDPRQFFLYEQYADAAAIEAHRATPHFKQHVLGTAIPALEAREVRVFETLD